MKTNREFLFLRAQLTKIKIHITAKLYLPLVVLVVFALLLPALQQKPSQPISPEATTYLENVLDIMQNHSINRYKIDWDNFRWRLFTLAEGAQTPADTHSAIRFMTGQLGDRHSRFVRPPEATGVSPASVPSQPLPGGKLIEKRIGYLLLPYHIADKSHASFYAQQLHVLIQDLDAQEPCGWIVDLSENQGGNMWPMLAGIGPILGTGEVGYFLDPDGETITWSYHSGQAFQNKTSMVQVDHPYVLRASNPTVAILTGKKTASSGEAIVVAFRGRPNTRSFGDPTAGLSTGNETYLLSDGATLVLTGVVFVDRIGMVYGEKIEPDEQMGWFDSSALESAIAWLLGQPSCADSIH